MPWFSLRAFNYCSIYFAPFLLLQFSIISPTEGLNDDCIQVCRDELHITYNDRCPTAGTCSWQCAALKFESKHGACKSNLLYMCAKNAKYDGGKMTFFGYAEACVHEKTCSNGV